MHKKLNKTEIISSRLEFLGYTKQSAQMLAKTLGIKRSIIIFASMTHDEGLKVFKAITQPRVRNICLPPQPYSPPLVNARKGIPIKNREDVRSLIKNFSIKDCGSLLAFTNHMNVNDVSEALKDNMSLIADDTAVLLVNTKQLKRICPQCSVNLYQLAIAKQTDLDDLNKSLKQAGLATPIVPESQYRIRTDEKCRGHSTKYKLIEFLLMNNVASSALGTKQTQGNDFLIYEPTTPISDAALLCTQGTLDVYDFVLSP